MDFKDANTSAFFSDAGTAARSQAMEGQPEAKHKLPRSIFLLVGLFLLGWLTEDWSLFDLGHYSIPLLYLAALPVCFQLTSRSICFLLPVFASTIFGMVVGIFQHVGVGHVLSQSALQLLAILFGAGAAAIDWRRYFHRIADLFVMAAIPVVVYGGYQMIARSAHLPFAFLTVTNQQQYALGGLQRGWEKPQFTRASSFFVEPASFGYFCLWLFILGLSKEKGGWRITALTLALAGILFSQSLSAALGLGIILMVYLITNPISLQLIKQVVAVAVLSMLAIIIIPPLMPEAFEAFSKRINQALAFDSRADSGRVDRVPANIAMIKAAPLWGQGISSMTTDGASRNVSSISYTLLLMERGLVGTVLFFVPWLVVARQSFLLPKSDKLRTLTLLLVTLHLYAFATSSLAYFLPYWFALGVTASINLGTASRRNALPNRRTNRYSVLRPNYTPAG